MSVIVMLLGSNLYCSKSRKADIFVEHLDLAESDFTQHVQLEHQRPWGVFLFNVGKHLVSVGFVLESAQVFAVLLLHQLLDRRDGTLDQIEYPQRATRP